MVLRVAEVKPHKFDNGRKWNFEREGVRTLLVGGSNSCGWFCRWLNRFRSRGSEISKLESDLVNSSKLIY
jgi:hypothetical protein